MTNDERDKAAEAAGNSHANPVIRSMYPSKSRGQMAAEFATLFSLGWDACSLAMRDTQNYMIRSAQQAAVEIANERDMLRKDNERLYAANTHIVDVANIEKLKANYPDYTSAFMQLAVEATLNAKFRAENQLLRAANTHISAIDKKAIGDVMIENERLKEQVSKSSYRLREVIANLNHCCVKLEGRFMDEELGRIKWKQQAEKMAEVLLRRNRELDVHQALVEFEKFKEGNK